MKTFKKLFLLLFLMSISSGYALTNYCATSVPSTSNGGAYSVKMTCRNVSGTTYEYKLEFSFAVNIVAKSIGSNPGPVNIAAGLTTSDNKTFTSTFTSASAPSMYINYFVVTTAGVPGEIQWNEAPKDANWAATCVTTTAPLLTTTAATAVGNTVGTMNGNISANGGSNIDDYGFYWSTNIGFADGTGTKVVKGTSNYTGNITHDLTGLAQGTPYYYKAYAHNALGTTYGAQQTFTTTSPNPPPSFGPFTIPDMLIGSADFLIPQPTTTSNGTIAYNSSNTGVATIVSGNMLHIVGVGTTTITLTQGVGTGNSSGSTFTTFTVTAITTPPAGPTAPPARNSWDVISEYSTAYTNQPGIAFDTFGVGGTTIVNQTLADNSVVKKYTGHSYSGIGNTTLNVSAMTHMHIDVWSPNFTSFRIKLEAHNGAAVTARELDAPGGAVQGTWNSYEIPLSAYSSGADGVDLTKLYWIVPVTFGQNATLYVTNIYFYRAATTQPPLLGAFTVPAKNMGDADFVLDTPTSNSSGAWSYSSGSLGVATIVNGNMIHIVGGGSSLITATQAANGPYGVGTATATFVVTIPPLTTAAPTPPARIASDVMSVYSNAYTPVPGTRNYNPGWGQSTSVTYETIGADNLLKYSNLNYQGTDFGSNIDVSGMTYVHIDVYTTNETSLNFYLISTNTGERPIALTPLTQNGWNSYDIPLTSYTSQSGFSLASLFQFKMVGSGGKTIYVDNMYFWKPAAEFINPAITLSDINKVLGDSNFTVTASSDSPGAITYSSGNPAVATISGNTVHIVGAGTSVITASQAASGLYNPGSTTATLTVTVPPLSTAAPTPPARNAWDVLSIYSNAYTTYDTPTWQNQATTTEVQLQGNDTKKSTNFLIETVTFTGANLTAMTTLHMDIYSEDCTGMNIWLLNNGDRRAAISLTPNQWNSIDIPLSTYVSQGLNMNGVIFIKFESLNGGGKTVYADNIYFYRPATSLPPTITDFAVPAQAAGNPDFTLDPPTSNSAGTFTYSSSNPAVATIIGNTVHIVGGGTSTITATQAAAGGYGTGSITAQLVVAFAPPVASPIPPARTPDRVVSMFTGNPPVYANAITAVSAGFSGAVMTEVPNGGNTALKLNNFGVLGLVDQTEARFDVSGMSHLHIDIYLNEPLNANPAVSRINIFLLANGDYLYPASNLTAGWNSLSIPMTNFSAANLTQVWGLKLENINAATEVYIDNVYFSNECYTYYADADNDTFGNPAVTQQVCNGTGAPAGYVENNTDCDDTRNAVHPGGTEVPYNLMDDDCDGSVDEGYPTKATVMQGTQCNTVLPTIDTQLVAYLVAGAQGYRWRISTLDINDNVLEVQEINTQLRVLKLTQLPHYAFNTRYKIEVAVFFAGYLQPFTSSSCTVTTPSTTTSLVACGQSLTAMTDVIYANIVPFVTGYRFEITEVGNAANIQEIDRPLRDFRLNLVTNFVVQFGKSYQIRVAVRNTDGSYLPYGPTCNIYTPVFPTSSLQTVQCNNYVVPNNATQIYASSYPGAISYVFNLSLAGPASGIEVVKQLRAFTLNDFAGMLIPGATYNVRVRLVFNGTDLAGPYGKTCTIVVPGTARQIKDEGMAFGALAYPNPFLDSFNINVTTSVHEKIVVKVYDMTGRLLENRSANASEVETLTVGENFPSGVYNVIVSQGDEAKTLRVIKR
jgi:hypothetical protein